MVARQVGAIRSMHEELQMSPHVDRIEFAPYVRDLVTRAMPPPTGAGVDTHLERGPQPVFTIRCPLEEG